MSKEFNEVFQIKNKETYLARKDISDCNSCERIILDPRLCKGCDYMFCKLCLINTSKCPRCLIYPAIEPTSSNERNLDKVILTCKYGCEVPLSQAYFHMNHCSKLKLDIECWNCKHKTNSTSMKISQENKTEIQNKFQQLDIPVVDNGKNDKIKRIYLDLIFLEDDKSELEKQIREIRTKINIKETILLKIEKLKIDLKTSLYY